MKKTFIIRSTDVRDRTIDFLYDLPLELLWKVVIAEYRDSKTRAQEEKYHALIGDITPHFMFMDRRGWSEDDVKRLLIDAFVRLRNAEGRPLIQGGRVVPSLDGSGVVHLGVQSRQFTKEEASEFIEFLYAYGSQTLSMAGRDWTY